MHLLTPAAFSVSLARCERITEPRGGKKKTSDESQCTQWRCLHSAVRWYLQAIHHLWAVTAETQSYQYPSLPLLLQFHLSLCFTSPTDPSLPSLLPTFPPFPPHRPKPPPSSVSSLNPTYCLSQGGKHNHLFICFSLPFLRRLFIPVNTELPAGNKCKATRCQTEKSKSFTSCCFSLQSFHSFSSLFLSLPVLPNVCVLHNSHFRATVQMCIVFVITARLQ